jgi:hypothetical protein
MLPSYLHLGPLSGFLSAGTLIKNLYVFRISPVYAAFPHRSHHLWFLHPNNIWRIIKVMEFLLWIIYIIVLLPSVMGPNTVVLFYPIFKCPQPTSFFRVRNQISTHTEQQVKLCFCRFLFLELLGQKTGSWKFWTQWQETPNSICSASLRVCLFVVVIPRNPKLAHFQRIY